MKGLLHIACQRSSPQIVVQLVKFGLRLDEKDLADRSPRYFLRKGRRIDVVRVIFLC